MSKQIGTKEIMVNGQLVTVRVFAAKNKRQDRNEDTQYAARIEDVRYQSTPEDIREFLESR